MTKSPHPSSVDKGELLPVTVEARKAAEEHYPSQLWQEPAIADLAQAFAKFERIILGRQSHFFAGDVDKAARAAYAAHCAADPCNDFGEPDWSDGGYSAESFVWQAVAKAVFRQAHSLPGDVGMHPDIEGHIADAVRDACRIVLGKVVSFDDSRGIASTIADRIKIVNAEYAAALTPSALSGDAGETRSCPMDGDPCSNPSCSPGTCFPDSPGRNLHSQQGTEP